MSTKSKLTEVEEIKAASRFLRGTIEQGLADPLTGAIAADDTHLTKFHGIYMQDDRDLRNLRRKQKLEPLYSFMIRVRMPGGVCTTDQYLAMDRLAHTHANGTLKLTTRQTFQFHGVLKRNLKAAMQGINASLLDTIAACGDVNRNVMCNPNPYPSEIHAQVYDWSVRLSEHLLPETTAYHEIWLDGTKMIDSRPDREPMYGASYLPRKFKIAVAVPPANDVDVFAHDLGFIAILEQGGLVGFNVSVGGGMGMTHNEPDTYPRAGSVIGFCTPDQILQVAEQVLCVQRDFGDRTNRKHARLKYTIDDRGLGWFQGELERRLGFALAPERAFAFESTGDRYGWIEGHDGTWHLTLFVENGRIRDVEGNPMMTGIREVVKIHDGDVRLTANQNLILANVSAANKPRVEKVLAAYGLDDSHLRTGLRLNAMACVALGTCGLAMAESERYLPSLIDKLDRVIKDAGLEHDPIVIRMTGCPNGCARPYLAEIGFVGKNPGKYNLYLGAGFDGRRLNKLYRESLNEDQILDELGPMIHRYAGEREAGERFGDFVIRAGYVQATRDGRDFHD